MEPGRICMGAVFLGSAIFSIWVGNKIWPIWKRFIWGDDRSDPRRDGDVLGHLLMLDILDHMNHDDRD